MTQPPPESTAGELTPEDLERLVERVYRLLLEDLRREQARGVAAPRKERRRAPDPR